MKIKNSNGFTLIELMVTMAVAAILLSAGAPSFGTLMKNNRMVAENYALRTVLSAARSEAQTQRTPVTVCRSVDGIECSNGNWAVGYIAFVDLDQDGRLDSADGEQLLQARVQGAVGVVVSFSQATDMLRFDSNGNATGSTGTFTFCDDRGAVAARGIVLSAVGAVRAAAESEGGSDAPDIVDDHAGNDLQCA